MSDINCEKLQNSLISVALELFRFRRVFEKALSKLGDGDREKYARQFAWFYKSVKRALEDADMKIIDFEGQPYDPGMAVTPLNIDEFENGDELCVLQTIEPIVMLNDTVYKTGTIILGRIEK